MGRLAPEKHHDTIIQAIMGSKYSERICLHIIGEGPIKEELQHLGSALPNPPVFLCLTPEELVYYYNLADLYIHAATIEVECMTVLTKRIDYWIEHPEELLKEKSAYLGKSSHYRLEHSFEKLLEVYYSLVRQKE